MRNRIIRIYIVIFALFILPNSVLYTQVTIGAGIEPNKGALLDLKENNGDANNITTDKGIILPRVKLTNSHNLYPMFSTDNAGNYKEGIKSEEDRLHIGLSVYNIDECSLQGTGLYFWSGNRWEKVEKSIPDYIYRITDPRDGQMYLVRSFGTEAGDWMLENMRYLTSDILLSRKEDANYAGIVQSRLMRYFYPNGVNNGIPSTWNRHQGFLYSYGAATMGKQNSTDFDQGQTTGKTPGKNEVESTTGHIQGICPPGWHIPSDREWNILEKEIYNNPEKYSEYTSSNSFNPDKWNPAWETVQSQRGSTGTNGHAHAMLSACPPTGNTISVNGKSLPAILGGFDALAIGYADNGSVIDYGGGSYFWTSSAAGRDTKNPNMLWAWDRIITFDQAAVLRYTYTRNALFSVRCKKD